MAFDFVGSSSQSLSASSAPATAVPMTIAGIARVSSATGFRTIFALDANGASNSFPYVGQFNNTVYAATDQAASNVTAAGVSANTFFHACGVLPSGIIRGYCGGSTSKVEKTSGVTSFSAPTNLRIGAQRVVSGLTAYMTGRICEVAIWSVDLTDDEVNSLAKGFKPTRIRPQSLVFYAPLIRDIQDVRAGVALTNNNGATVANHPRVY